MQNLKKFHKKIKIFSSFIYPLIFIFLSTEPVDNFVD
ncbi:hypothetical protein NTHI1209_00809 [Haemophilus influenzae]|uniref:Uncharacterized protein n=1 Tax=Haemophilus influenzae TaxID=727 RepID=A0A158SWG2_HAEIF|nr:hypothetical protein NTHI1209_00809 [Haemophilus influenzae]